MNLLRALPGVLPEWRARSNPLSTIRFVPPPTPQKKVFFASYKNATIFASEPCVLLTWATFSVVETFSCLASTVRKLNARSRTDWSMPVNSQISFNSVRRREMNKEVFPRLQVHVLNYSHTRQYARYTCREPHCNVACFCSNPNKKVRIFPLRWRTGQRFKSSLLYNDYCFVGRLTILVFDFAFI